MKQTNNRIKTLVVGGTLSTSYTFPQQRGSNNQILKTNASGSITWQDDVGASASTLSAVMALGATVSGFMYSPDGVLSYLDLSESNAALYSYDVSGFTGSSVTLNNHSTGVQIVYEGNGVDSSLTVNENGISINNLYSLPSTDGLANQAIVTDGFGNLSFATQSVAQTLAGVMTVGATVSGTIYSASSTSYIDLTNTYVEVNASGNLDLISGGGDILMETTSNSILIDDGIGVKINYEYYLPNVDGTSNQVLTTNGSGVTSWQTPATPSPQSLSTVMTVGSTVSGFMYSPDGVLSYLDLSEGNAALSSYDVSGLTGSTLTLNNDITGAQISFEGRGVNSLLSVGYNGVRINNLYSLPSTDGTNRQVLTTNGSGVTSWVAPSAGSSIFLYYNFS